MHIDIDDIPQKYAPLNNKRILVTGASGFIGGALFNRLVGYGLNPLATVLYPEEAEALKKKGHQAYVLDLASNRPWDDILDGVDIVFNIAALFQEIEFGRELYDKVNHRGALKLAMTAERMGAERFVHCSTVGVFGNVKEIPATERTPFNPMDVYHKTKLDGERAILDWAKTIPKNGMAVTVNRPAMVYGPGDLRMLKLFKAIFSGKFLMIGSGQTLAHMGFIEDQIDSFLLCSVAPKENLHLEAFNIASGKPITLNDLCSIIANIAEVKLSNFKIPVFPVWIAGLVCEMAYKPFGIRPPLFRRRIGFFTHNRAFDYSKARTLLGYNPLWEEIEGLAKTIEWYKQNHFL